VYRILALGYVSLGHLRGELPTAVGAGYVVQVLCTDTTRVNDLTKYLSCRIPVINTDTALTLNHKASHGHLGNLRLPAACLEPLPRRRMEQAQLRPIPVKPLWCFRAPVRVLLSLHRFNRASSLGRAGCCLPDGGGGGKLARSIPLALA
jgi:hypothetical protein